MISSPYPDACIQCEQGEVQVVLLPGQIRESTCSNCGSIWLGSIPDEVYLRRAEEKEFFHLLFPSGNPINDEAEVEVRI